MSMNFELKEYINDCFIETGTFHGGGVKNALRAGFKKVISIEVFLPLVEENKNRFKCEIDQGIVEILHGDSADLLSEAILKENGSITYWFDAHIQTQNNAGVGKEKCPIVSELQHIIASKINKDKDIILIDDLRLIENPNVGWAVELSEMYRLIWAINPEFRVERLKGYIPYDVLACVPKK